MKVLLSIKPEFADKILNGDKVYEFRKAVFKNKDVTTVVIYATKPVGKVVGEFTIEKIISSQPKDVWKITKNGAGISREFFDTYFKDRDMAHAIKINQVRRYKAPVDLFSILPSAIPPQSFCYL